MKTGTLVAMIVVTVGALGSALYVGRYSGVIPATTTDAAAPGEDGLSIAPTGPYPKAVVEESRFEFGTMLVNTERSHVFTLRNDGTVPLKLKYVRSTCKCTVPNLEKDKVTEIAPGTSLDVTLTWTPKAKAPEFSQQATFHTNDPQHRELLLTVFGSVDNLFDLVPSETWDAGTLREGKPAELTGTLISRVLDEFHVTTLECPDPHITAEAVPLDADTLAQEKAKSGYEIRVTISPEVAIGRVDQTLTITTDDKDAPIQTVQIVAKRSGPVQFQPLPGFVWHAREQAITFPRFKASTGAKARLRVSIQGMEGGPMKVEDVTTSPSFLEASLVPHNIDSDGNGFYDLTVTVPPGSPAVTRIQQNAGTIDFRLNHPSIHELTLRVEIPSY